MKRSVQEIIELVVFGAIALLIGTGVLWLVGWVFTGAGWLALAITGLLWRVLIVLVPIVIIAGLIYWLVSYLMKQRSEQAAAAGTAGGSTVGAAGPGATGLPPSEPATAVTAEPVLDAPLTQEPQQDPFLQDTPEAPDATTAAVESGIEAVPVPEAPIADATPEVPVAEAEPIAAPEPEPINPLPQEQAPDATATSSQAEDDDSDRPLRNG